MAHKTEFLYMSEPDTIAAGVLDARKCIDNAEEKRLFTEDVTYNS